MLSHGHEVINVPQGGVSDYKNAFTAFRQHGDKERRMENRFSHMQPLTDVIDYYGNQKLSPKKRILFDPVRSHCVTQALFPPARTPTSSCQVCFHLRGKHLKHTITYDHVPQLLVSFPQPPCGSPLCLAHPRSVRFFLTSPW